MHSQIDPDNFIFSSICRQPDCIVVHGQSTQHELVPDDQGQWKFDDVVVRTNQSNTGLTLSMNALNTPVTYVSLRWNLDLSQIKLVLGDAWERSYGDLRWESLVPEKVMPWYWLAFDGRRTHGYGVETRPSAFCGWQADTYGVTLWADVRSGGVGLVLNGRELDICTVVCREGNSEESAFGSARAFCRQMCPTPRLPNHPVYGHNDWYADYGNNSDQSIREQCRKTVELSPDGPNRPYVVIDAGWQPANGTDGGPWDASNRKFPSMPALAEYISDQGARPGIWIRPLAAAADAPDKWRLAREHQMLDFTVPDVKKLVADDIARLRSWGYQLIKHDFTTFDILGRWGFGMEHGITENGWKFREGPGRTSAEVINDLYDTIREAAGDAVIIGCNTVSHLSAGVFEMQRIGDDTSGHDWNRTRKMGINTLAFRAPQHGTFYVADADCVGLTKQVPWELNAQWLELLSRSGTMTFVSMDKSAVGPVQEEALRQAYALAAVEQPLAEPLDWMTTSCPARWQYGDQERRYQWMAPTGASLFVPG